MSKNSAKAALYALCAALASCSTESPKGTPKKAAPIPVYEASRPLGGLVDPMARPAEFRRGLSLGMFVSGQTDAVTRPTYEGYLDEIRGLGATDLELVVEWHQADASSIEITPHPTAGVDDDLLTWVIDEANERNLRVFLLPIVDVEERATDGSRGTLTPTDWDRWWWSYERFIAHYARIAENHHVALFSVGSELLSTEREDLRWRKLITNVRKIYSGKLTYSAKWDHFEPVSFWDALDVVGVTGHHELTLKAKPSDLELARGFDAFTKRLRSWALANNRRYILTEVGYPAQAHAAARPWDQRESGSPDLLLQLRCYRALFQAFQEDPRLEGLFVSDWVGHGGARDAVYSPRGKPAAEVVRHWYVKSNSQAATAAP